MGFAYLHLEPDNCSAAAGVWHWTWSQRDPGPALFLTTPASRAMAAMLAVFTEREVQRERVRADLAHARRNGKTLGRSLTASLNAEKVRNLYRSGISKSQIARQLSIGRTCVRRILAASSGKKLSRLLDYASLQAHRGER